MGEVMTHPLNDYEQKLREKRRQSHPSISSPTASNIINFVHCFNVSS